MLISWDWIRDYVKPDLSPDEVAHLLTMSGLNLESIVPVGRDVCIDLEVTSNRPDCLGHLGIAREIAALLGLELTIPDPQPETVRTPVESAAHLENLAHDLCPSYLARVIRGVKVGPSPKWLIDRLATIGQKPVNNIVDVTNYVLMECGQPLHAFDLAKLDGSKIVVRPATAGEKMVAIDQREYPLSPGTCVIADASRPVAIAGVMGGLETEISAETVDVLIETAAFQPRSIRHTARALKLFSDSSYRFERGVDIEQLDWASRRCCELIQQVAGGELLRGVLSEGDEQTLNKKLIGLRFAQIERILGISIDPRTADEILRRLGLERVGDDWLVEGKYRPPSWRRDLSREIDLVEEVARVYGYDHIPDHAPIRVVPSSTSLADRVSERVRETLTSLGFYECVSLSFVDSKHFGLFVPPTTGEPLAVDHSTRRQENLLRQSLIPSLLQARRDNEKQGRFGAKLFEIARVYLSADKSLGEEQTEPRTIGFTSGGDLRETLGAAETLAARVNRRAQIETQPCELPQFTPGRGAELRLDGQFWGWIGELNAAAQDELGLRDPVCVAELRVAPLQAIADLSPRFSPLPQFPSIERDLNFVLDETTTWSELEAVVRSAGGALLESVRFSDQYRGKPIPVGRKSYVLTLSFRSAERTLTSDEVEAAQHDVVAACRAQLSAELR